MIIRYCFVLSISLLISILYLSEATLTPKSSKAKREAKEDPGKVLSGPVNQTVVDRNLVVKTPTAKSILHNHQSYFKDVSETNFEGLVLGYVTPWNNHGYDIAKLFGSKFSHISPVWLQVKRKGNLDYEVLGTHDVDKKWMKDVKKSGQDRKIKIVPRLLFDGWTMNDFKSLLGDANEVVKLSETLVRCCQRYDFDGLVVEVWSQVAGNIPSNILIDFIKVMATYLTRTNLDFILVVLPMRDTQVLFTADDFANLYNHVTAFSLMTYDYSSVERPGPNAPIQWIEECVTYLSPDKKSRNKILTGLNFYGNAYTVNGGKPIVGHEYLTLLKHFKGKMDYDPVSAENYYEMRAYDGKYMVFYPTLHSINERLLLADKLGTGISIWELGQGLDYFYDLL